MFLQQPEKGNHHWYSYMLTIIFVIVGYILFQLPMIGVLMAKIAADDNLDLTALEEFEANPDFSAFGIDKNLGLALMIFTFLGIWVGIYLGVKYLHRRSFLSIITPERRINWKKIFWAFGVWMILALGYSLFEWIMTPEKITFQFNLSAFIPLLIVAILFLPIQTTAEELFFRGYLFQSISYLTKRPWIGIVLTSLLFGLIHGMNPEIKQYGVIPMQMYYIGAGIFLALITVMDDGLELAIGVHAATNIYGAVISSYEGGVIQTDSILKSSDLNAWEANAAFFLAAFVFYLICRRRYHWPPLKQIFQNINRT